MIIERSIQLLIFVFSRRFTMPFAWSFMHMFQEDGKLTASGEVTFRDLMRTKSDHTDDKLPDLIRKREKENKVGIRILVIWNIVFTSNNQFVQITERRSQRWHTRLFQTWYRASESG